MKLIRTLGPFLLFVIIVAVLAPGWGRQQVQHTEATVIGASSDEQEGHAWEAFEWWYGTRAYPNESLPKSAFYDAFVYARENLIPQGGPREGIPTWSSIGPDNIGGRILSLAIDPSNPGILWAGSASGGLWRSTNGGEGSSAWTRIETGFPALSVSAIVLDPAQPQVMYIGTGEISRYQRPMVGTPGARSSYGLGILKSTDGGSSWQETGLTWTFDQTRAVLAIKMDPSNPQILWAATSEGLYKTTDGGANWTLSNPVLMAMDVVIDPWNPQRVWSSHGQLNSTPDPGIYRTTDGGQNWTKLGGGLPTQNFGRTPLTLSAPNQFSPLILWAGVSDANTRAIIGLFKSTNGGDTWTSVNGTNWAGGQAWYDNVIGVSPFNSSLLLCGGLDWYRSTNGGSTLSQVSYWYAGYEGVIPPGGPEGPPNYVHADHHALAFHPTDSQIVYVGTDGGVFKSTDSGLHWAGKNGGLVTTQIYNGFANGYTTPALALGGLQDNGTIKYLGTPSWSKVFGGDGGWCAIDRTNENILYEEYVYLNMYKSTNGGSSWFEIHAGNSSEANFIAPFVLSESNPSVLYAGTRAVHKSTNGGSNWFYPDGNSNWNGTPMAAIAVSFGSPDTLCAATGSSSPTAVFEVRRSTNGGQTWTNVTGSLPTRYPTDFAFDPTDGRNVWLTFSGYGTPHVFRSTDAGMTWEDRSSNLPDIPVQSVAVDPINPEWVYIGTDLGVYRTLDAGAVWTDFNAGMPIAMVLDVNIMAADRLLRAATFGNGVYEVSLPEAASADIAGVGAGAIELYPPEPNPFGERATIRFHIPREESVDLSIYDALGRRVRELMSGRQAAGSGRATWDGLDDSGHRLPLGLYIARLSVETATRTRKITLMR